MAKKKMYVMRKGFDEELDWVVEVKVTLYGWTVIAEFVNEKDAQAFLKYKEGESGNNH